MRSASQVSTAIASADRDRREQEAEGVEGEQRGADREPDAGAERAGLVLQLEPGELELELASALACSATCFAAAPTPGAQRRGWAWPLQSITFASTAPAAKAAPRDGERVRPAALPRGSAGRRRPVGAAATCRPGSASVGLAARAGRDQRRLQLAQEGGVVGELVGELRLRPPLAAAALSARRACRRPRRPCRRRVISSPAASRRWRRARSSRRRRATIVARGERGVEARPRA